MSGDGAVPDLPAMRWVADVLEVELVPFGSLEQLCAQCRLVAQRLHPIAPVGILLAVHPQATPLSSPEDQRRLFAYWRTIGLARLPVAFLEPAEERLALREWGALEALEAGLDVAVFSERAQALMWLRYRDA